MAIERPHTVNFKVTDDERRKLKALADAEGEDYSTLLRRFIKVQFEGVFNGQPLPPLPTTRGRAR